MTDDADLNPGAMNTPHGVTDNVSPLKSSTNRTAQIFEVIDRVAPYAALLLSMLSFSFAWIVSDQSTESQSVNSQYQIFIDLAEMGIEHPDIGHLLALPKAYDSVACDVARHIALLPAADRAAYPLKERAAADYIFTLFERSVYHQPVTSGWRGRLFSHTRKVNDEVVAYFTQRLLRNPRLLWYWDADGGGLRGHYEPDTIRRYEAGVLKEATTPPRSSSTLPACTAPLDSPP